MKVIKSTWLVPTSRKPTWLLSCVAQLSGVVCCDADKIEDVLRRVSDDLDSRELLLRNCKYSCALVKREIIDNKVYIYSTASKKPYVFLEIIDK